MTYIGWSLVILLTSFLAMLVTGCLTARPGPESRADRLADPEPMPGELPAAGYLPVVDASLGYLPGPPFAGAADPSQRLSPFPGEGVVTHNELDQFARHYQGLQR